jgi:hypothetical protein
MVSSLFIFDLFRETFNSICKHTSAECCVHYQWGSFATACIIIADKDDIQYRDDKKKQDATRRRHGTTHLQDETSTCLRQRDIHKTRQHIQKKKQTIFVIHSSSNTHQTKTVVCTFNQADKEIDRETKRHGATQHNNEVRLDNNEVRLEGRIYPKIATQDKNKTQHKTQNIKQLKHKTQQDKGIT